MVNTQLKKDMDVLVEGNLIKQVFWIDLKKVDLKPGAKAKKIVTSKDNPLAGEVSSQLKEAEPFKFL